MGNFTTKRFWSSVRAFRYAWTEDAQAGIITPAKNNNLATHSANGAIDPSSTYRFRPRKKAQEDEGQQYELADARPGSPRLCLTFGPRPASRKSWGSRYRISKSNPKCLNHPSHHFLPSSQPRRPSTAIPAPPKIATPPTVEEDRGTPAPQIGLDGHNEYGNTGVSTQPSQVNLRGGCDDHGCGCEILLRG